MKYFLDTHVFLWSIADSSELSKNVITALKNPENEIFVSSVTLWEITLKTRVGKLAIQGTTPAELPGIMERLSYSQLTLTPEDALGYLDLHEPTHKDPFDRMLIWQCIRRDMTMISRDGEFPKFVPFGLKLFW
ncbi:MAG: DNA-binding protein [Spirochaetes bacterium RIFOXYC1_FULL_54_7]|nr:MAG: DNA-binding protein [Spirochaetes bacterium RIFOXYC1_FULL_54_7]